MDKKAMYKLTYGLFVLTANENGKDNGCIINTAIQAAGDPNQISISVSKQNYTYDYAHRHLHSLFHYRKGRFLSL